jgi:ArsR family transcriptional regulator
MRSSRGRTKPKQTQKVDGECEVDFVDEVAVASVRAKLPADDVIQAIADRYDLLSDPTRLRILYSLSLRELCVCDLAKLVGRSGATVSHQLADLRKAGLVRFRMDGKLAYYSLADKELPQLLATAIARAKAAA